MVTALIESVRSAIALILPMLAIAVPNRDSAVVMAVIVAVIGLIAAWMIVSPVVRWLTTGYRMDEHGITQRSGVFNRTRTTIAYDHIHTLSSSAPIYMRPFQVVILNITAAGTAAGMAVAVIWALVSRDAVNWLWTLAPAALAVWWGLCRWLKAASEGYAVLDDKRIAATGVSVLTLFTVFTRRSRIQSVERSSTPWRLNRGVECLRLPLFVSNGISALQFTALRSADAATVSAWAEDGSIRPSGTSDRSADSDPRNMTDNGHRDDDGWRAR